MKKTIGILAHADAGKTTLSEQLLYRTQSIRTLGRVDQKSSFLDVNPMEKERGITIFSGQARFCYNGSEYLLLDTPGHADFSPEMERALLALDYAVVLVSCVEGVQGHTETIWRLLSQFQLPALVFLNKTDRAGADIARTVEELRRLTPNALLFSGRYSGGVPEETLAEELAERDDDLLEQYLERGWDPAFSGMVCRMVRERRVFPVFAGSALTGEGVEEFLSALDSLTETGYGQTESGPFGARVYQIRHDARGNRLAFLKITSGFLAVKQELAGGKVNELRLYNGEKFQPAPKVRAGELCAVLGLPVRAGDFLGAGAGAPPAAFTPVLAARVLADGVSPQTLREAFLLLEDEEPSLRVEWNEAVRELRVHVMGEIQLEVLSGLARERFGLTVSFGPCEVCYLETLAAPTVGIGHFEPLRHYAEVHLRLSPGARGSGISFSSECPTDRLDSGFQNLIRTHVLEKTHRGVLTGAPLADVQVALLTGRAHLKHTEGGDFRQAVYRAVRQGLAQAKQSAVLLEPYYDFSITVPAQELGRVLADVQRLHGSFEPPETGPDFAVVRGRGPAACFLGYAAEVPAFTRGRGSFTARFGGYEPCHNTEEIVALRGYDMERDLENTPDSVFCAKGAGYTVRWYDVPAHAHCSA